MIFCGWLTGPSVGVLVFNHFNIRAPRPVLEDVKNFYLEVIGLTEGFRPDKLIHGYLLYLEDSPVLYLMEWNVMAETPKYGNGHLDHVAFSCDGLEEFINRLKNLDVVYTRRDFNIGGGVFTQLEVTDPVGNGVELNFSQWVCRYRYGSDTLGSDFLRKNIPPEKTGGMDLLYSEPPTAVYKAEGPPKHFMIGS